MIQELVLAATMVTTGIFLFHVLHSTEEFLLRVFEFVVEVVERITHLE